MPKRTNRAPDLPATGPPPADLVASLLSDELSASATIESAGESQTVNESVENAGPQIDFKPANAGRILSEVISETGFTLSSALKSVSSMVIDEPNGLELQLGSSFDFQRRVIEQPESRAAIEAIVSRLTGVTATLSLRIVDQLDDLTPENFIRKMHVQSEEFAVKSTQLSKMLEQAEQFLQQMPGKFKLLVGSVPDSLSFERQKNEWNLFYGHEPEEVESNAFLLHPLKRVTQADVVTKAKAAILLPELFSTILDTSSKRLHDVDQGLKALQSIPFLKEDG